MWGAYRIKFTNLLFGKGWFLILRVHHLVVTSPKLNQNSKRVTGEAKKTEHFSVQKKEMAYTAVLIVFGPIVFQLVSAKHYMYIFEIFLMAQN